MVNKKISYVSTFQTAKSSRIGKLDSNPTILPYRDAARKKIHAIKAQWHAATITFRPTHQNLGNLFTRKTV